MAALFPSRKYNMETQNKNCQDQDNYHNPMEREMLKKFRKKLADVLRPEDTDTILLKWIRGQNFHLKRSEELYREFVSARLLHKLDPHVETKLPEVFKTYEFANLLGNAKDGTPIRYMALGRGDLRGFLMSADGYDLSKYCCYEIEIDNEKCREQSLKLGKEIHQVTYIGDMEGFSLKKMLYPCIIETALDLFRLLQEYYPEIWRHIFVVNAPPYFYTFFNLIKPILGQHFLKNIEVVSREQTAGLLLKYIDADVLPAFLGGKRVDSTGNPMCPEFMKFGGTVPEKYFLRNKSPLLPSDEGAAQVWIPSRGTFNYPVVVQEAGWIVRVEFRTECGSVNHCILFRDLKDPQNPDLPAPHENLDQHKEKCNVILASPSLHCQSHISPVNNRFFPPKPGIYILKFDNSYNWLSSRKLIYRIRLIPSSEIQCNHNCNGL